MKDLKEELEKKYGEKATKPCERCKLYSHPGIHTGCGQSKHKNCNWYTFHEKMGK